MTASSPAAPPTLPPAPPSASTRGLLPTRPVKRSFTLAGHRTSISLEAAFWDALREAAAVEGLSLAMLVARIDAARGSAGLSGAVRVWVLDYFMRKARGPWP